MRNKHSCSCPGWENRR
ncbi:hypothetical protein [Xenorhabdus bovienii]